MNKVNENYLLLYFGILQDKNSHTMLDFRTFTHILEFEIHASLVDVLHFAITQSKCSLP